MSTKTRTETVWGATCAGCESPLEAGQTFCHVCGTQRPEAAQPVIYPRVVRAANGAAELIPGPGAPVQPWAVSSLVLGCVAYGPLPVVGAVLAIVFGHMARRAMREAPGRYRGKGLATAGLVLGYAQLGLGLATILSVFGFGIFFYFLNK